MPEKVFKFEKIEEKVIPISNAPGRCVGEVKPGKYRRRKVPAGKTPKGIRYEKLNGFSHFWWKPVGAIVIDEPAAAGKEVGKRYIRVMKRRKLAILALILIILTIAELAVWFITGQNAIKNTANYIGSQTNLTQPNKDVKGTVDETTAFESMPETVTWNAGSTEQSITLKNIEGNSVELAPQIFVDFNNDGKFADNECVFNSDAKQRIQAGKEVNSVKINKQIPAGTYKAEVIYKAFVHSKNGEDTPVNGMNFNFNLVVQ